MLRKSGYETSDFADAETALQWLESNKPIGIIMDILLPDLNGTELLGKVRSLPGFESIPIIAVTGFAQSNDRDKYIEMGFDSYIAKPINTATFVQDVAGVIGEK